MAALVSKTQFTSRRLASLTKHVFPKIRFRAGVKFGVGTKARARARARAKATAKLQQLQNGGLCKCSLAPSYGDDFDDVTQLQPRYWLRRHFDGLDICPGSAASCNLQQVRVL